MTVSASRSSYVDLRIPSDARLSLNYWSRRDLPTPRFSPGDEFAALVLASRDTIGMTWDAFRLPDEKGVVQRDISLGFDICQLDRFCEIEAGNYRLFLVTEVPTTVEIVLKRLRGRSNLELNRPMVGEISGATASYLHSTPEGPVGADAYGVGFSPMLTGDHNFLFSAFWFRGPNQPFGPAPADKPLLQIGDAGGCEFYGVVPEPEEYAPGCPTGSTDGNFSSFRALDDYGFQQWGSAANIRGGQYGEGYFAWHTGVRDPGFIGFWLDLAS